MTMFGLVLLTAIAAAPDAQMSVSAATKAIARGESVDAAVQRIKAAGKPGLWALHDAAKQASGIERGRLFEAIGRYGTDEGEWALIVELKGSDAEAKAGAIRGLAHLKSSKSFATIARHAESAEPVVRDAIVQAILDLGGGSEKQQRALIEHANENAREVGMRVLAARGTGEGKIVDDAIAAGLRDAAPGVRYHAVALVRKTKDQSRVFALSELARADHEDVALLAVETLSELGGWNSASELAGITADPTTKDQVWTRAAIALRGNGSEGFNQLLDAIARARDDRRKSELAKIALEKVSEGELEQIVNLLDDPTASRAAAGRVLLIRSGEPGKAAAQKRLETALPELKAAIESCLAEAASRTKDLEASLH